MVLCKYCLIKNLGRSVRFTTWQQYENHIAKNHPGFTVMAYPIELEQFRKSLPSYYQKLKSKMKAELHTSVPRKRGKENENHDVFLRDIML